MVKQGSILISVCLLLLLSGCSEEHLELWVSTSETSLYLSPVGDELKKIHTIKIGVACVPGKEVIEKVYQYFEVLCEDGSYGWITSYSHFKVLQSSKSIGLDLNDSAL